jgi:hypothetical protein
VKPCQGRAVIERCTILNASIVSELANARWAAQHIRANPLGHPCGGHVEIAQVTNVQAAPRTDR